MKRRTPTVVAWVLWLLPVTGWVVGESSEPWWAASLVATTVGALLVSRRPENRVGWVLTLIGPITAIGGWGEQLSDLPGPPWIAVAAWWMGLAWAPLVGLIITLLLVFPSGRLLSPRWRWALWALGTFVVLAIIGNGLLPVPDDEGGPNPVEVLGAERWLEAVVAISGLALLASLIGGLSSLAARHRRGGRVERQQLKWFVTAAALVPVALVIGDLGDQRYQDYALPVAMIGLSLAVGIAVMKYRLYEIDRIINRTIVYGAVTALLALTYLASVTLLSGLARPLTGNSDLAVAASTLGVAALFGPLRRRVARWVDRAFYRSRYDTQKTLEAFSARLRDRVGIEAVGDELVGVVRSALQPSSVSVWVREEAGRTSPQRISLANTTATAASHNPAK